MGRIQDGQPETSGDDRPKANKRRRTSASQEKTVPPGRLSGSYQRTKAPSACLVCRARKTRCDNVRPTCGFCQSTNGDCRYTEPERSRFDPASIAILQQLDEIKTLLQGPGAADSPTRQPISGSEGTPDTLHGFDQYAARLQTASDMPISSEVLLHTAQDMGIEAMLQWPVLRRQLTRLGLPSDVSLLATIGDRTQQPPLPVLVGSPGRLSERLSRQRIHELVNNFLVNNNLKNPIFEPSSLRKHADAFATRPLEWSGRAYLMFLVLAIGCISTSLDDAAQGPLELAVQGHRSDEAYHVAAEYFNEAQQRLGALTHEESLLTAQCYFLTGVYHMYTMRMVPAWQAFVLASSNCLLHVLSGRRTATEAVPPSGQGPSGLPSTSTKRALEDALYWSCLKSEVELRLELGLPGSGITSVQYPHVFPCVPNLDVDDCGRVSAPYDPEISPRQAMDNEDKAHFTSGWFFFLAEIALKRLTYDILHTRYGGQGPFMASSRAQRPGVAVEASGHQALDLDTAGYDEQLEQWMQLLPPAMQFPAASSEPLHDILPWVLRGHYIDAVEMLRFRDFAAVFSVQAAQAADDAVSGGPGAGGLGRRGAHDYLRNAVRRIEANAGGLFHRHQGSWLAIRSCSRSALALLCAQLASREEPSLGSLLPLRWREAVLLVVAMLRAWEAESADVARLRVVVEGLFSLYQQGTTEHAV